MKSIIFIICLTILFSCGAHRDEVVSKSNIKFEGRNTNIRDLLDIDGCYGDGLIFYDDGTTVACSMRENIPDSIGYLFDYIYIWSYGNSGRWGRWDGTWGVYSLRNDTIVVHSYSTEIFDGWGMEENRFKIINRRTIQLIYRRSLLESDVEFDKEHGISPWTYRAYRHFTPVGNMPPPDIWLKKKKWMWRNETDWQRYMQHVKEVKRQYKEQRKKK